MKNEIYNQEIIDAHELAARLQVPVTQVYRLARTGGLPVLRIGKYRRFSWEEVLRALGGSRGEGDERKA